MKPRLRQANNLLAFAVLINAAVFGYYRDIAFARNLLAFASFLIMVLMIVAASVPPKRVEVLRSYRAGNHLPKWLDVLLYYALICIIAGAGHYVVASVWVVIMSCDLYLRDAASKTQPPPRNPEEGFSA